MIIKGEEYVEHYGKKGMKWGTRKEQRAVAKALSPKGHRERAKRANPNRKGRKAFNDALTMHQVDRLVAFSLANPKSLVQIRAGKGGMTVTGKDFAEIVVGRFGDANISVRGNTQNVTRN